MIVNCREIVEGCDIASVAVELGVDVKRSGASWYMRCPKHFGGHSYDRHIGNCSINKSNTKFLCRSCGNHGDASTLVQQVLNISFPESIEWLSEFSGIEKIEKRIGEEYKDANNKVRVVRRIISREEQKFLEINNEPVYVTGSITDSYYESKEFNICHVDYDYQRDEVSAYVEQKVACSNPLRELAAENYSLYVFLVKNKILEKYEDMKQTYMIYRNTVLEAAERGRFKNDLDFLRKIYLNIDGNPAELVDISSFKIDIRPDLSRVAF